MTDFPTCGSSRPLVRFTAQMTPTPVSSPWRDLGVVESIAGSTQPPISRAIVQLQPLGSHIVLGYGEWDIGLDRCDLIAWNTQTMAFESLLTGVATDAFWTLRAINDEIWALTTDPSVGTDPDAVIFDGERSRILNAPGLTPWHLFDIWQWHDALFVAGANRVGAESRGAVWRSEDAGESWTLVHESTENLRIHGLFDLGELLYAVGFQGQTWVTDDGQAWQPAAVDLLPRGSVCVRPVVIAGYAAYLNGWSAYGAQDLCVFDGNQARLLTEIGKVVSAFSDGQRLTVLTRDRRILQSNDLSTWNAIREFAPIGSRSVCTHDGALYVGTADSHVWQLDP
jgi:hypothetical protein